MQIPQCFLRPSLLVAVLFLCQPLLHAQDAPADKKSAKKEQIRNMIDSQNYIFRAQTALPLSGRSRQLTSDYDLKITKDVISSDLPYFGRAYSAPIDPTQGGIRFTSKDFDYTATPRKKGGWDILIKPKDNRDVQQMSLTVSENGYGNLQVVSINRQAISFTGTITAIKPPKQKTK